MRNLALFACLPVVACVPDERPASESGKTVPANLGARSLASAQSQTPRAALTGSNRARYDARIAERHAVRPVLSARYSDNFERTELGPDWNATNSAFRIQDGRLCGRRARNHPVWLKPRLPTNARIEFDASSASPDGDLKVEVWGDGRSAATSSSYTNASSYIVIFGGWKNTFHVLARIDEHAAGRSEIRIDPEANDPRSQAVTPDRTYHFKIERSDGKTVRFYVNDVELLTFSDPNPLRGPGHEYFGFNDWDTPVCFDNLVITPLPN